MSPGNTTPTASSSSAETYESSSLEITQAVSAWFLGPRMENADLVKELFAKVVDDHIKARSSYHPEDGDFVTSEVKSSPIYQRTVHALHDSLSRLSSLLNDNPVPFYSPRYAAHMTFDSSLPSIAGWMTGLLLNPNNISFEAGPLTTLLELEVGDELCRMIGFKGDDHEVTKREDDEGEREEDVVSWGHLTADGTVANIEAIWVARNLKFYALALRRAMADSQPFEFLCKSFKVTVPMSDSPVLFASLSTWTLLNLPPSTVLSIPDRLRRQYGVSSQFLENTMTKYIVQSAGMSEMISYMRSESIAGGEWGVRHTPKMLVSATKHYSWSKGVALTGIGSNNLVNIPVDAHARIHIPALRSLLEEHLASRTPIYAVVATIGTTEEGAVDPLREILALRDEYEKRGLCFLVHADAAWGGYFASTLREPPEEWDSTWPGNAPPSEATPFDAEYIASLTLKPHTVHQLEALSGADSVTVDPHKSGYCPHPIGGLCYKDRRMMHLLTWSAPYVQHGDPGESIGRHGVEGSKAGAAATAVYMHHSVVGLHKRGHGGLLGEVAFTCARLAAHLATMSDDTTPYTVTPFNPLRFESHIEAERPPGNPEAVPGHTAEQARERLQQACRDEKEFIKTSLLGRSNAELVKDQDPAVIAELKVLGSDLNISAFVCNFRVRVPKGSRSRTMDKGKGTTRRKSGHLGEGTINVGDDGNTDGASTPRPSRRQRNSAQLSGSFNVHESIEEPALEGDEEEDAYEWVLNDDVSEANYLNRRVFDRLSVTDLSQDPSKVPLFISATIMRSDDYGECMKRFKERAGLETESGVDLYVLRHAVMSPFQTGAGFAKRLAETFQEVLEECLQPVVVKNTITPQIHRFVVQGTDRLFLAYQPTFHKANGRQQLILEVEVQDMAQWNAYQAARAGHPYAVFELWTTPRPVTIEEFLEGGEVPCLVLADQIVLNMTISNARVVKNRSLLSRHLDRSYDTKYTPFYLYGTRSQPHIDHMLLRAPNAQFTAENVVLELDREIPLEKLAAGVLLYVLDRPEETMQPFGQDIAEAEQNFFVSDAEFEVMVCDDPFPATAHGPGLASAGETGHPVMARGTMRLPFSIFVDMNRLNCEDFGDDVRVVQRMDIGMNWEDRSAWSAMVAHRLDMPFSDYLPGHEENVQPDGGLQSPVITTEVTYERD